MEVEWIHFSTIPSTHTYAVEHAASFSPQKVTCFLADEQSNGRGRFAKRGWISKRGNLHLSLFIATEARPYLAQLLAFAAAEVLPCPVHIKWPNDLFCQGKKIAGTIAEITPSGVIFSIGINVNAKVDPDQPAISLKEVTGKEWDLKLLAQTIVERLLVHIERGFPTALFNELLLFRGERVLISGKRGIVLGVTNEGFLQLQQEDGAIEIVTAGEGMRRG